MTIKRPKLNLKPIAAGVAVAFLALWGIGGISNFDPGEVGVVVKNLGPNRGMQEQTYTAGTFWIEPVTYDVTSYDVRSQQYAIPEIESGTKDGQPVVSDVSLECNLTPSLVPQLHETVGKHYYNEIVYPAVRDGIRKATASTVSDVIYTEEGRRIVSSSIDAFLFERFSHRGINCHSNVRDISFVNKAFVQILERKAGAGQLEEIQRREALAAEQEAIKVANIAEGLKQKTIKEAEAAAEKVRLSSEAEKTRMQNIGEGSKLQKIAEAEGLLAMKTAEAEGRKLLNEALAGPGGERIVEIEWAQNLGPNVKVYGFPTGAQGTNSFMDVNGFFKGLNGTGGK